MVLKDKKKKKKPRPRRLTGKPSGRLMTPVFKTGMNRDIPLGGAGGSQNLLANLQASRQAQPSAQVIQTPDQFKLAQDIKAIRSEQADIAEEAAEQKKERKKRWDYGLTIAERDYERVARAARAAEEKAAAAGEKRQRNEDKSKTQAERGQEEPAGKVQPDPLKGTGRTINKSAGGAGVKGQDSSAMNIDRSGSPPTYL